jgi:hypothetical protein
MCSCDQSLSHKWPKKIVQVNPDSVFSALPVIRLLNSIEIKKSTSGQAKGAATYQKTSDHSIPGDTSHDRILLGPGKHRRDLTVPRQKR